ncbi:hypothetical protein AVE30378_02169 [Achromobacter veterisilvae]|uniref:Uncharacterized protein n=1 Tax=Achromobacter veterisilvae TaxID=2069367 RepID=A0A446CFH4_9BURK|nr:hypothetical protein AVE30378_02169 [Achromobacter veterisilvae]
MHNLYARLVLWLIRPALIRHAEEGERIKATVLASAAKAFRSLKRPL